jgi:hypothetical protein
LSNLSQSLPQMQSLVPRSWANLIPTSRTTNLQDTHLHSWPTSTAAASSPAYHNERYRQFFQRYQVAEIMRGYELAQDSELFTILRTYNGVDLRLLLKFREDDALEFFEGLKDFRGSDILEHREAIIAISKKEADNQGNGPHQTHGSYSYRLSNASRDSGYESRPSSEIDGSMGLSLDFMNPTPTPPHYVSPSTQGTIHGQHTNPISESFLSSPHSKSCVESHQHDHLNSPYPPRSPQWPLSESATATPFDTSTSGRPRLFECMYCPQDFVRYGDCLNHEQANHSQRKEWICPHCRLPSKTKVGHGRHHRNHRCQPCILPENVVTLSGPKTASACYYCGQLFEGNDCFASRATHIKAIHYKSGLQKTKADIDRSGMIMSLLSRTELSAHWKSFLQGKPNFKLSWSVENARELVDALEFGEHPNGTLEQIERVYELADKVHISTREHPTTEILDGQVDLNIVSATPLDTKIVHTRAIGPGISPQEHEELMDLAQDRPTEPSSSRSLSTLQRTREVLSSPLPDAGQDTSNAASDLDSRNYRPHSDRSHHWPPPPLRNDVFMGSRRSTPSSSDHMDLSPNDPLATLAPAPRNLTPPSGLCAFWDLDGSLMHMEDIMTQHILESSQTFHNPSNISTYTPPGWENALPPSIEMATKAPSPLGGALPWPPYRRTSRN